MKVCMFVLNNCRHDTRVLKEARTLTDAGHDVRIIALLDRDSEPYEERDGFRIIRVARDPINVRAIRAVMRAGSSVARSILRPIVWAYRLATRRSTRSSLNVIEPAASASRAGGRPAAEASRGVDEPSLSARSRVKWLISVTGRAAGAGLYWVLRTVNRPFNRAFYLRDYWRRSWMALKDEPADVYHCHDLNTLPAGYMARRRTGGKLVYDSHELYTTVDYISRAYRSLFRVMERFLIHRVDAVITVNEFFADWLSIRYRITPPVVVRNCPPLAGRNDRQRNPSLRERLDLGGTVPIIIHIGIFGRSRGSEKLISAVPFLNDGVVVFLGWGSQEAELKELVRRAGLEHRVLFAPPVATDQVVGHISSAQVAAIPLLNCSLNHYYNTPNKLWESIGAGLPVVASNFPALKSVIEGYGLGETCNPEDPEDIANAINHVLSDKSRYEKMKRNALEAARIFNWENESKKLLELYTRFGGPAGGASLRS
jgi:glycosyltransferase involved in cell wall biosynthesis